MIKVTKERYKETKKWVSKEYCLKAVENKRIRRTGLSDGQATNQALR